jgi:hypothetical protein
LAPTFDKQNPNNRKRAIAAKRVSRRSSIGIGMLFAVAACSSDHHELVRHISPDQKLVAVLMESGRTDAPERVTAELFLNDQGLPLQLDKPVLTGRHCDGLSFSWLNDYTLEVRYPTPCAIEHFTNRWQRPSDVAAGHENPIEIILVRS